ncbi:MAG: transketolase [Alphaproteobacteria bacterium]|jgi:pyruvate dehydrogenase E1 component|nr:transketolase [Alphaproteobacteria bacterium]PPR13872.1 MAG: Pyruvate dehydrogenase E1 component [Alphaproteobacteria bacterium MarineAlpha12_Bin1]|tara:strand:+ start:10259 stop:12598 length:2340 start_codon:yes stop_codon:yes gene_type:complete
MSSKQNKSNKQSESYDVDLIEAIERKVLWLSSWLIHNANHIRPNRDGLKVGGHQASCASAVTLLTVLYMSVLRPEDRIAIKPHASPVFHAIQYMFGRQSLDQLERFRALGGAQSYPSRTKDSDDVDFSTGSVGLGVGATLFGAMIRDYVKLHHQKQNKDTEGLIVALLGDAELDEGNVFEALLEGWKHDVRNLWWIIDYNRQSLDGMVQDNLFQIIKDFFGTMGWNVTEIKYGKRLEEVFKKPSGDILMDWIDNCPNQLYSALTFQGGSAWRSRLKTDIGQVKGIRAILDDHDDAGLHQLMTNLGGHDIRSTLEAFNSVKDDTPQCFVAYTIKGYNTPLAGHKDNHSGLMNLEQMEDFKSEHMIRDGHEWDITEGLHMDNSILENFLNNVPFNQRTSSVQVKNIPVPSFKVPSGKDLSTQEAFGRILNDLGREKSEFSDRIVTTTPDVTVTTNMAGWVNQRGLFHREEMMDLFREEKVPSAFKWTMNPSGQHIELGIAENNLFLLLSVLGLSDRLFGTRLFPVSALYDPFISRGLDSLNYACYQDARFLLVATPSGISLAPEGGAHQSVFTPLIGIGQPGLTSFEPAFADELTTIMQWSFEHMQKIDGGAVYLRLSTRNIDQSNRSNLGLKKEEIVSGAYWLKEPDPGSELAIIYSGAIAPEAILAHDQILEDIPGAGLLAITSPDLLYRDWNSGGSRAESLLSLLAPDAALVTVLDGHPATLSWLGAVLNHTTTSLGVDQFGQSGNLPDLYREYKIDADAIIEGAAESLTKKIKRSLS